MNLNDTLAPKSTIKNKNTPLVPVIHPPQELNPYQINHRLSSSYINELFRNAIEKGAFKNDSETQKRILRALTKNPLLTHSPNGQIFLYHDVVDVVSYLEWYSKDKNVPYRLIRFNMIRRILIHEGIERALRSRVDFDAFDKLVMEKFSDKLPGLSKLLEKEYGYPIDGTPEGKEKRKLAFYHLLSDVADDYDEDGEMRDKAELHVPASLKPFALEIFDLFNEIPGVSGIVQSILKPIPLIQTSELTNRDSSSKILFETARTFMRQQEQKISKSLGRMGGGIFKFPTIEKQDQIEKALTVFRNAGTENRAETLIALSAISGLKIEKLKLLLKYFSITDPKKISEEQWMGFKSAFLCQINPLIKPKRVAFINDQLTEKRALEFILKESEKQGLELALLSGRKTGLGNGEYETSFFGGQTVVTNVPNMTLNTMMKEIDFKLLGIEALVIKAETFDKISPADLDFLREEGIEIYLIGSLKHYIPMAYGTRIEARNQQSREPASGTPKALLRQLPNGSKKTTYLGASVIKKLLQQERSVGEKPGTVLCAGVDTYKPSEKGAVSLPDTYGKGGSRTLRDALGSETPTFNSVFYETSGEETLVNLTFYADRALSKEEIVQAFETEAQQNEALTFPLEKESILDAIKRHKIVFIPDRVRTQQTEQGILIGLSFALNDRTTQTETVMRFISGKTTQRKILSEAQPLKVSLTSQNQVDAEKTEALGKHISPLVAELRREWQIENIKRHLKEKLQQISDKNLNLDKDSLKKQLLQLRPLIGEITDPEAKLQVLKTNSGEILGLVVVKKVGQDYHIHASSLLSANKPEEISSVHEPYYKALRDMAFTFKQEEGVTKVTVFDTYKPEKRLRVVFEVSHENSIKLDRWEQFFRDDKESKVLCRPNLDHLKPLGQNQLAVVLSGGDQIGTLATRIITTGNGNDKDHYSDLWLMGIYGSDVKEFARLIEAGDTVTGKFPGTVKIAEDSLILQHGNNKKQFACFRGQEDNPLFANTANLPLLPFLFAGIPITVIEGSKPNEANNLYKAGARRVLEPSPKDMEKVFLKGLNERAYQSDSQTPPLVSFREKILAHLNHILKMASHLCNNSAPLTNEIIQNLADTFQTPQKLDSLRGAGDESGSLSGQTVLLPGHITPENLENAVQAMEKYIENISKNTREKSPQKDGLGLYSDIRSLIKEKRVQIVHVTHDNGVKESILKINSWSQNELEAVRAMLNLLNHLKEPSNKAPKEPSSDYLDRMTLDQLIEEKGEAWFEGKKFFMRVDFNVVSPKANGIGIIEATITDDYRIQAAVPDIKRLKDLRAKVILASHNARYEEIVEYAKKNKIKITVAQEHHSLKKVSERLTALLGKNVPLVPFSNANDIKRQVDSMNDGEVLLLENLRFHEGEAKGDAAFAKMLFEGILPNAYMNNAFGAVHRGEQVSENPLIEKIRETFPEAPVVVGNLVHKELQIIKDFLDDPEASEKAIAILGGSKVMEKVGVMKALIKKKKVKKLVIVGMLASPFLALKGYEMGNAFLDTDPKKLKTIFTAAMNVLKLAEKNGVDIVLPLDFKGTGRSVNKKKPELKEGEVICKNVGEIEPGFFAYDVGPKTVKLIEDLMQDKKYTRVLLNGTAGLAEVPEFNEGTDGILTAVVESRKKILGMGGDGVAAINAWAKKKAEERLQSKEPSEENKILGNLLTSKNLSADELLNAMIAEVIKEYGIERSTGGGASLELIGEGKLSGLDNIDYKTMLKDTSQKTFFVGGLWRNAINTEEQAISLIAQIAEFSEPIKHREKIGVVVFPKTSLLKPIIKEMGLKGWNSIKLGVQDLYLPLSGEGRDENKDILTAEEAKNLGVQYVVIGYTDRNQAKDNNHTINLKIKDALDNGLTPILCIGETMEDREDSQEIEAIKTQLEEALQGISKIDKVMIAYQPVWAIGTGKPANPQIVNEANQIIYDYLVEERGEDIANKITLLYGGSVKPRTVFGIVSCSRVNGTLVGSTSEEGGSFVNILKQEFLYIQRIEQLLEQMKPGQPQRDSAERIAQAG